MAIINIIKQRIRMLEAGSFQNLCDHILSNMGYDNLVSLGSQAGTQKTTKGTPDTYCIVDEDKYVFIEYTTQDTRLFQNYVPICTYKSFFCTNLMIFYCLERSRRVQ